MNKFGSDFIVDTETKEFGVALVLLQKYYAQKILIGFKSGILQMFAVNIYTKRHLQSECNLLTQINVLNLDPTRYTWSQTAAYEKVTSVYCNQAAPEKRN